MVKRSHRKHEHALIGKINALNDMQVQYEVIISETLSKLCAQSYEKLAGNFRENKFLRIPNKYAKKKKFHDKVTVCDHTPTNFRMKLVKNCLAKWKELTRGSARSCGYDSRVDHRSQIICCLPFAVC